MNKLVIFFLAFFILGFLFFSFRITDVPPGINGDEAAIGYNAALVAKTGHDSSGRFLPLFVSAFDLTDWKQPITFYSTVLAFKLFGPTFILLREVSVVFVLISAILIFLLGRELMGLKFAFISLFIFITIPSVLIQSHLALENIAPVPFTILWLLMLAKYKNTFKQKFLYLGGLFLGIDLFSYSAVRIIFPIFCLLSIGFVYYLNRKKNFRFKICSILKFSVIVAIFPFFMLAIKDQYPGAILAYNRPHGVPTYQEFVISYISSYDPSFLFIQGDSTPYHSTGKQGVFLLATLPLFVFGIWRIAQRKDPFLILILLTFLLTPAFYGLAASIHRGSRLLSLLPTFTIITSFGAVELFKLKKFWKNLAIFIICGLIILNYLDFTRDYFYDYPNRVKSEFAKPYQLVFEKAGQLVKSDDFTPYIQSDFRGQNEIAIDFFEQTFPGNLKSWKEGQAVPAGSVIIVSDYILAKKKEIPQFNTGEGFGLLINQTKNAIR